MRFIGILALLTAASAQQSDPPLTYLPARMQGPALTMEIVKPDGAGPFPTVLLLHGGGFEKGAPRDVRPLADQLKRAGIASVLTSYRLAPRFQYPAQVHDVKTAVRYLRTNGARLSLNTERLCAVGQDSGATLALFLGFTKGLPQFEGHPDYRDASSAVDCVVSIDALSANPPAFSGAAREVPAANPASWASPDAAPVLSITTPAGADRAKRLTARLRSMSVDARAETSSTGELSASALTFLRQHLTPLPDRWTILLADHGPARVLVAIGWPSGKVLWSVPNGAGLDVHALPNRHVLFTNHAEHRVVEIDDHQKEVWSVGADAGLVTPYSVRRLDNGNTLIGDSKGARVLEFTPQGTVAWKWEKPELAELWPRMSRPIGGGSILVTFQKAGKVFEVDRQGKTQWEYTISPTRLPYQALRLPNGNTVIGLVDPGEVIEVDRNGKTVRSIGGPNSDLRFGWLAGIDLLPGGGIMIADFTSHRIAEVDAAGKLVHEIRNIPWSVASIAVLPANPR